MRRFSKTGGQWDIRRYRDLLTVGIIGLGESSPCHTTRCSAAEPSASPVLLAHPLRSALAHQCRQIQRLIHSAKSMRVDMAQFLFGIPSVSRPLNLTLYPASARSDTASHATSAFCRPKESALLDAEPKQPPQYSLSQRAESSNRLWPIAPRRTTTIAGTSARVP
jgi:hypothetical protein